MKQRFPVPGFNGQSGGFFDTSAVRQAAVVVDIIDQGEAGVMAEGQKIPGGIGPVVVFQGQTAADGFGQALDFVFQLSPGQPLKSQICSRLSPEKNRSREKHLGDQRVIQPNFFKGFLFFFCIFDTEYSRVKGRAE